MLRTEHLSVAVLKGLRHCERSEAIRHAALDCFVADAPRHDAISSLPDGSAGGDRRLVYGVSVAADGSFLACSMLSVMIFVVSITDWLSAA